MPAPSPSSLRDTLARGVLFTSFEPSGDDHAAPVIAELKRRWPALAIHAWGGPKMQAAGATILHRTGETAVMGVPGIAKILEHVRINRQIEEWLDDHPVALHIPVDSPDANFPICKLARDRGARVIHLVAPQLWAWREGRIKKLRRRSQLVLCILPFEENWFVARGMPARYVGHPLFDTPLDFADLDRRSAHLPRGTPNLALMPGSRPVEIKRSFPALLQALNQLKRDFPDIRATLAVTRPGVEYDVRKMARRLGGWPECLSVMVGDTDAVIRWCDMAIVASGTVTLQIARQLKPMVTFYRFNKAWILPHILIGKFVFSTRMFTLPNLIAGRRIVPELVPHFGDGHQLAVGIYRLLRQPGFADDQKAALAQVLALFEGKSAKNLAADAIGAALDLPPVPPLPPLPALPSTP
ncbi:lipid-A-disaccharide synthase [soil metagenome]